MATLAPAAAPPLRLPRLGADAPVALLLLVAAVAVRWPQWGDPLYDLDEQWYLLVGERLRGGAVPYVDLWDRKPVGLFLLYALLGWGSHAVAVYQFAATLAAAATAWTIARIAAPQSDRAAGALAGLAYLAWIGTVGGGGGQSPVFYDLPVALAAGQVLAAIETPDTARFRRSGLRAMLLVGLALQIKYTVVVEGAAFGLALAAAARRRLPARPWGFHVAALAVSALAPTLAAAAVYALLGHLGEFWYANFRSILARSGDAPAAVHGRLWQIATQFAALAPCWLAACAVTERAGAGARRRQRLVLGWMAAALGGFACVGTFYFHYALPLFVPACVLAAPAFGPRRIGRALGLAVVWLPLAGQHWPDDADRARHRAELARLAAAVPPAAHDRCLAVLDGPPMLYLAADACVASRYAFPGHLLSAGELHALGTDRAAEIERLFARSPAAVVLARRPYNPDPASAARIARHLRAGYRVAATGPWDGAAIDVWIRRRAVSSPAGPAWPGAPPSVP